MKRWLRRTWEHPVMEKWGRLALTFMVIVPVFLWFQEHPSDARRNQYILLAIMTALAIGLIASIITTVRYPSRSLGLFAILLGSLVYYGYLFLLIARKENHLWMADFTRSCFIVGSPLFAIATVVTLIQMRRTRNASKTNRQHRWPFSRKGR